VNIFDEIRYLSTDHSVKRLRQRFSRFKHLRYSQAEQKCEELADTGQLLIEIDDYRYIKNGDVYIPCMRHYKYKNAYVTKSILTWEMVKERLQSIIDRYHLYKEV
jgi:hypothetical protein